MIDDHEYGDEEWIDDECEDSADDLLACPSCKRAVHEDTQQCPHCGDWITPVAIEPLVKRVIWLTAAVLVILSMILYAIL